MSCFTADHNNSAYEGTFYQCDQFDYKCGYRSNFKKHYLAEHEMVWYPCDKLVASSHCDYHATSKSSRGKHIKSVHEGIKYPCPQCDYQAPLKGALRRHIQSTHEGIKISLSSL